MFIYNLHETITQKIDSDVFVKEIFKSIAKKIWRFRQLN